MRCVKAVIGTAIIGLTPISMPKNELMTRIIEKLTDNLLYILLEKPLKPGSQKLRHHGQISNVT
jgi:hypothetical protein